MSLKRRETRPFLRVVPYETGFPSVNPHLFQRVAPAFGRLSTHARVIAELLTIKVCYYVDSVSFMVRP